MSFDGMRTEDWRFEFRHFWKLVPPNGMVESPINAMLKQMRNLHQIVELCTTPFSIVVKITYRCSPVIMTMDASCWLLGYLSVSKITAIVKRGFILHRCMMYDRMVYILYGHKVIKRCWLPLRLLLAAGAAKL